MMSFSDYVSQTMNEDCYVCRDCGKIVIVVEGIFYNFKRCSKCEKKHQKNRSEKIEAIKHLGDQ